METSYKEKYEQAIEKLRNFCRDYDTVSCLIDVKEELANLFPELAESEDEKIRKWIINEIKIKHHNLDEENVDFVDKAIAWLEKQGEQKPAEWSEEDEQHVNSLLKRLQGMCKKGATYTATRFPVSQDIDWLKSLKERKGGKI